MNESHLKWWFRVSRFLSPFFRAAEIIPFYFAFCIIFNCHNRRCDWPFPFKWIACGGFGSGSGQGWATGTWVSLSIAFDVGERRKCRNGCCLFRPVSFNSSRHRERSKRFECHTKITRKQPNRIDSVPLDRLQPTRWHNYDNFIHSCRHANHIVLCSSAIYCLFDSVQCLLHRPKFVWRRATSKPNRKRNSQTFICDVPVWHSMPSINLNIFVWKCL